MSEHDEPLDPSLADLVRAERDTAGAPASVREAVRARVRASIAAGGGSSSTPSNNTPSSATPPPTASPPSGGAGLRRLAGWIGLIATGAAIGAMAHAQLAAPRERIVYVDRVVDREVVVPAPAAPPTMPTTAVVTDAAQPDAGATMRIATNAHRSEEREEPATSDLDAERALLDRARSALVRGRGDDALAAISERGQRFPHGQLAEEFEGLRVQALVNAHRYDEARVAAARFHQRFGDSLLGPVVDAAIRTIP